MERWKCWYVSATSFITQSSGRDKMNEAQSTCQRNYMLPFCLLVFFLQRTLKNSRTASPIHRLYYKSKYWIQLIVTCSSAVIVLCIYLPLVLIFLLDEKPNFRRYADMFCGTILIKHERFAATDDELRAKPISGAESLSLKAFVCLF